jgi:mono/diheme cytochrome c family protein
MKRPGRTHVAATVLAALVTACRPGPSEPPRKVAPTRPGMRLSMMELHRTGGVPPGWRFMPPPGDPASGRRLFISQGCSSCHAVAGEPSFPAKPGDESVGPELTGMGSHHPGGYFAESIVNPDAVLVDGPGYVGPDGHSVMPAYPDLTIAQLADLVSYVQTLTAGGMQHAKSAIEPIPPELPAPPPGVATRFFVQVYDVEAGRLDDFERWLHDEGFARLFSHAGLASVETYVDLGHGGPAVTTVFGFTDEESLGRFLDDPATDDLGAKFDSFIGPHDHRVYRSSPLYRAASLSAERPAAPPP